MILDYHRPENIEQALELLARNKPDTRPMGGGSVLNAPSDNEYDVVDLQLLNLNKITKKGNSLEIGATVTLQSLLDNENIPTALADAIKHEATRNLRQVATIAGALVSADGRSPFATVMLAMDAQLIILPKEEKISYGELLPLRADKLLGQLISRITIPLKAKLAYQYVARSPADLPIVCVALTQWSSDRTRLVLGGYGHLPILAMDGKGTDGLIPSIENAFSHAGDQWASSEYRLDVTQTLVKRCMASLNDKS